MNRHHFCQPTVAAALVTLLRVPLRSLWPVKNCSLTGAGVSLLSGLLAVSATTAAIAAEGMVFPSEWPTRVELDINETRSISRNGGAAHQFKLLSISHQTMPYRRNAAEGTIIYAATVEMEVDGVPVTLTAECDAGEAYLDIVDRFLGQELPFRFMEAPKRSFISRIFGN